MDEWIIRRRVVCWIFCFPHCICVNTRVQSSNFRFHHVDHSMPWKLEHTQGLVIWIFSQPLLMVVHTTQNWQKAENIVKLCNIRYFRHFNSFGWRFVRSASVRPSDFVVINRWHTKQNIYTNLYAMKLIEAKHWKSMQSSIVLCRIMTSSFNHILFCQWLNK